MKSLYLLLIFQTASASTCPDLSGVYVADALPAETYTIRQQVINGVTVYETHSTWTRSTDKLTADGKTQESEHDFFDHHYVAKVTVLCDGKELLYLADTTVHRGSEFRGRGENRDSTYLDAPNHLVLEYREKTTAPNGTVQESPLRKLNYTRAP